MKFTNYHLQIHLFDIDIIRVLVKNMAEDRYIY